MATGIFRLFAVFAKAVLPLFLTGCLFASGTQRTEFDEAERMTVRFSSAKASREFHEGYRQSDREIYTDMSGFVVPFLVARGGRVYHETEHYNAEVRLADVDRDGRITEEEAQQYLAYVVRHGDHE